ncbi:MAG: sel1 repeat family protein, partial [Devosia sp.]|nr:sel1 repeat family protein [Devosia sp.]
MSLRQTLAAGTVLALGLGAAPAFATELFDACAAKAASPYEAGYAETGLDSGAMDTAAAIDACTAALAEDPDSATLKAWLGRAYDVSGDSAQAATYLEPAAAAGSVLAQTSFGDILIVGQGVTQDMTRGAELLRLAADAGFAPAQDSLGLSYDYGEGVGQDYL